MARLVLELSEPLPSCFANSNRGTKSVGGSRDVSRTVIFFLKKYL